MIVAGWAPLRKSASWARIFSDDTPASCFMSPRALPLVPWQFAQVAARLRARVASWAIEGAAATIMNEAVFHGVRCGLIHPGYTDTPMVRALGDDYIGKNILPYTQLGRLIRPEEIADAICFMLANSAVSGELWADAGWHPPA